MPDPSPNAAAIVKAFDDRYELGMFNENWQEECLAAALRAVADQVAPEDYTEAYDCCLVIMQEIRSQLLAIAVEMEAQ